MRFAPTARRARVINAVASWLVLVAGLTTVQLRAHAPLAVHSVKDVRASVRHARLTRPLVFDGGALRLEPVKRRDGMSEARAIQLFRAGSTPSTTADQVVVTYAEATLRLPIDTRDMNPAVVPKRLPTFTKRKVWVVTWVGGAHSCTAVRNFAAPTMAEPQPVDLFAADDSGEAAEYRTHGALCSRPPTPPTAQLLGYNISVRWTLKRVGQSDRLSYAVPPCGVSALRSGPSGPDNTLTVYVWLALVRPPCRRSARPPLEVIKTGTPPAHGPVGLATGRVDGSGGFAYFDGATHHL